MVLEQIRISEKERVLWRLEGIPPERLRTFPPGAVLQEYEDPLSREYKISWDRPGTGHEGYPMNTWVKKRRIIRGWERTY